MTAAIPQNLVDDLVRAQRRAKRASERLEGAQTETKQARQALDNAKERIEAWIAANPDPQQEMFPL